MVLLQIIPKNPKNPVNTGFFEVIFFLFTKLESLAQNRCHRILLYVATVSAI